MTAARLDLITVLLVSKHDHRGYQWAVTVTGKVGWIAQLRDGRRRYFKVRFGIPVRPVTVRNVPTRVPWVPAC